MKMNRSLLVGTGMAMLLAAVVHGQERLPEARPSAEEIRAIRQMVEKQGRELDEVRQALAELTKILQLKEGVAAKPPPGSPPPLAPSTGGTPPPPEASSTQPVDFVSPSSQAAPPPGVPPAPGAGTSPPPAGETRAERAEPAAPGGSQHTVAKGETLTSIAKHYNVSIAELHKANKVVDERKLQIGQVLQIPVPKPPETATEKKEKP